MSMVYCEMLSLLCACSFAFSVSAVVALEGAADSHIFPDKLCSEVNTDEITVGGRPFDPARDRLAMYGNGAIVIADGWVDPLIIYSEPAAQGQSRVLQPDRFYRGESQGEESYLPRRAPRRLRQPRALLPPQARILVHYGQCPRRYGILSCVHGRQ